MCDDVRKAIYPADEEQDRLQIDVGIITRYQAMVIVLEFCRSGSFRRYKAVAAEGRYYGRRQFNACLLWRRLKRRQAGNGGRAASCHNDYTKACKCDGG